MKNEKKKTDVEIVVSIIKKIKEVTAQELMREEVMPRHITVALLFALSNSLVAEAAAHAVIYGTDPEDRIISHINGLRERTLLDLKERLSHGEE